ncbi:CopG family transcriptional regulator [Mycobacterium hodleri]|uniref:type II toxin-antitoxin system BrnA family antitoxin n=1 Tax=Mycolicibacterium hodleri TaxID=49897 RepID=UPI0021F316EC|nr:BrnA antitoxin family protein [Mycolicibacterium hodleri]MCV7131901.1 CopG family transcriptional regulator [Mycolicibacterium hodleri]
MKAEDFDERFDAGVDLSTALDTTRARRPGEEHRRVNVDFPAWMIVELDREATRLGVTRQSLIKVWIADKLDHGDHSAA